MRSRERDPAVTFIAGDRDAAEAPIFYSLLSKVPDRFGGSLEPRRD